MEMEADKPTFSAFERFLYWFLIPIIFTSVLLGALLSLFDYDVKNQLLKIGDKVPGLSAILPDPKVEPGEAEAPKPTAAVQTSEEEVEEEEEEAAQAAAILQTELDQVKSQLAVKEAELRSAEESYLQQDQTIKDLQAKIASLEEREVQQAKSDEEYQALIAQTASMYAKMSPSKAASIMENLAVSEQVLLLSEMKTDDQVRILEKMSPQKAAEASIYLKDLTPAKDRQIAALQERLALNESSADTSAQAGMTKQELGQTFAAMTAASAAQLLVEMEKTTPAKVTEILTSMDAASRAKVMTAIANESKETAAAITLRLAP